MHRRSALSCGCGLPSPPLTRRDFLTRSGMGMGALGASLLLAPESFAAGDPAAATFDPLAPRAPHFPAKAKHVIHVFLNGGASHVDTFDPKPALALHAGKTLPMDYLRTERKTGAAFPSPFKFERRGESGLEISEIFSALGAHADKLAVIRSMKAELPNHEPSLMLMNCGDMVMSRPSVGAWVTYGLGSANRDLPAFVAMCPGGYPIKEAENWQSGFLPGVYQGTFVDSKHTRIERLIENIRNNVSTPDEQRAQLDLLRAMNEDYEARVGRDAELEARVQSFELAYRMQSEAAEAFDTSREPEEIRAMYGDTVHGRQTLVARRLIERGVRFVQLWHGAGQPWDTHDDIERHRALAGEIDRPLAALLTDLERTGLLDETLILIGGEFGRTPTVELQASGAETKGRDHNPYGFSVVLAGAGIKGGTAHGATDEFGFRAVESVTDVHDLHATMLHLLGFDHERLTYRYAGRDFRLTDVKGRVVREVLA